MDALFLCGVCAARMQQLYLLGWEVLCWALAIGEGAGQRNFLVSIYGFNWVPHWGQNLSSASMVAEQEGQVRAREAPHSAQNLSPLDTVAEQEGQVGATVFSPFS